MKQAIVKVSFEALERFLLLPESDIEIVRAQVVIYKDEIHLLLQGDALPDGYEVAKGDLRKEIYATYRTNGEYYLEFDGFDVPKEPCGGLKDGCIEDTK